MLFNFEAVNKSGKKIKGQVNFSTEEEVVDYLEDENLIPVNIEKASESSFEEGDSGGLLSIEFFERVKEMDKILIARNLSASLKAGLGLMESLEAMIVDTENPAMRKVLKRIRADLESGQSLYGAVSRHKEVFSPFFTGMIRAGEHSGTLGQSLRSLSDYLTREYQLKRRVKSALIYPSILVVAAIIVVVILLTFVLPRLTATFQQAGVEFPLMTRIFVQIGEIIAYSPLLDILVVGFLVWFFTYFRKTGVGQRFFIKAMLKIPVTRSLVKKLALARMTKALSSLVASGLSLNESLELASGATGNYIYINAIDDVKDKVQKGISLADALSGYPDLFPHLLVRLVRAGESTGTLEDVLDNFADFYDEELEYDFKALTSIIEPTIILVMGFVVAIVIISVIQPIYGFVSRFG